MQRKPKMHYPGFGQRLRVFQCDVEFEIILIDSVKALDDVKLIAVRTANAIEPCLVVKAHCVHDENVAVPAADGMAHVGGRDVLGMLATIGENVADGMIMLVKQNDFLRSLYHLHRNRLEVDPGSSRGQARGEDRIVRLLEVVCALVGRFGQFKLLMPPFGELRLWSTKGGAAVAAAPVPDSG